MYTRRRIRSWLLGAVVTLPLSPLVVNAATDDGTVTIAGYDWGTCRPINNIASGYFSGLMGAYSPTELSGGETVYAVYDVTTFGGCGSNVAILAVSGFASNPGSGWLTSITCNGVTQLSRSASSYVYSSGVGYWHWSTHFGFLGKTSAGCSVTHS